LTFEKVLSFRAQRAESLSPADAQAELRNVNALYSLLDDRYKKKYQVSKDLLRPSTNPSYYDDLIREMEEQPNRNWWQRTTNRWKGFIRFR
jgi:cytochrome b pre-mRNA-processing protein 6